MFTKLRPQIQDVSVNAIHTALVNRSSLFGTKCDRPKLSFIIYKQICKLTHDNPFSDRWEILDGVYARVSWDSNQSLYRLEYQTGLERPYTQNIYD